jgi:RHS repeat-associated protein
MHRLIFLLVALLASSHVHAQLVEYIHTDALGSVAAVSDANGSLLHRREWEPYGAQLSPAPIDGPGYTGHVQDAATGLVYMQQRYYDPVVERFLSADPDPVNTATAWNFNRYYYGSNSPYRYTDPDGRQALDMSSKFQAAFDDCRSRPGCNPLNVPDQIADAQAPLANAALAMGGVGAGRGLIARFTAYRAARAERAVAQVVSASGGSIKQAVTQVNSAGLNQQQALQAVRTVTEGSGRSVGGVAEAANGAKVMVGVQAGRQGVVHVAENGTATFGTANVQFVREGRELVARVSDLVLKPGR